VKYLSFKLDYVPQLQFSHSFAIYNYRMPLYCPGVLELSYIEKGSVMLEREDGMSFVSEEGMISPVLLDSRYVCSAVNPDELHQHSTVGIRLQTECKLINLEDMPAEQLFTGEIFDTKDNVILPLEYPIRPTTSEAFSLIKKIVYESTVRDSASAAMTGGMVMQLLATLSRETIKSAFNRRIMNASPGNYLYSRKVIQYLSENYQHDVDVNAVAEEMNVSSNYLSGVFKKTTGMTIISYLNRIRVEKAKELLLRGGLNLHQIGEMVGIPDENYLSRLFSKYEGVSPRKYRSTFFR